MARLKRERTRLSRSGEFERVYKQGDSHSNRFLVLYAFPRAGEAGAASRMGVSVGRRVGNAVERNRVKRALREAYAELSQELPTGHDYVLVGRPEIDELLDRDGQKGVLDCLKEVVQDSGLTVERNT